VTTVYVIYVLLVTDIMTEQIELRRMAFTNKDVCYYYRDKVLMQYRDPVVNKVNCRSTIIYTSAK